jgi:hypothetical protein
MKSGTSKQKKNNTSKKLLASESYGYHHEG